MLGVLAVVAWNICFSFQHANSTAPSPADAEIFDFSIAAGDLSDAIQQISKQANVEILTVLPERELTAEAIHARLTIEAALARLLKPLAYEVENVSGGYVVRIDAPQAVEIREIEPVDADPDVITVSGFRNSLIQARDIKFQSLEIQDSIVAQDIARFPDLNLAESVQRIPGVTITRERGEGAEISLRGLGPDFTRVHLNGMEVLTNTDRDRGFEFNVFASELFSRIEVKKAYTASLDEGGIGGTVQLYAPKPFDFPAHTYALSAQLGTNTNAGALDHRMSGLFSARNDRLGALLSVAYSDRTSEGQDASTFRYRARSLADADISALTPDLQRKLNSEEIFLPRGNRYRVSSEQQERIGVTSALQWRPDDRLICERQWALQPL